MGVWGSFWLHLSFFPSLGPYIFPVNKEWMFYYPPHSIVCVCWWMNGGLCVSVQTSSFSFMCRNNCAAPGWIVGRSGLLQRYDGLLFPHFFYFINLLSMKIIMSCCCIPDTELKVWPVVLWSVFIGRWWHDKHHVSQEGQVFLLFFFVAELH